MAPKSVPRHECHVNQTPARVRRYLGDREAPYRPLWDEGGPAAKAYKVPGTSYVVIIDAKGRVVYTGFGGSRISSKRLKRTSVCETGYSRLCGGGWALVMMAASAAPGGLSDPRRHPMTLSLTSPAFSHNGEIPKEYTCDGKDTSAPLEWSGAPARTKSFALIVDRSRRPRPKAPKTTWCTGWCTTSPLR